MYRRRTVTPDRAWTGRDSWITGAGMGSTRYTTSATWYDLLDLLALVRRRSQAA
jgi:hypothetical protein